VGGGFVGRYQFHTGQHPLGTDARLVADTGRGGDDMTDPAQCRTQHRTHPADADDSDSQPRRPDRIGHAAKRSARRIATLRL
jgi:hypothetical protein